MNMENTTREENCHVEDVNEDKIKLIVDIADLQKVHSSVCSEVKTINGVPWKVFVERSTNYGIRIYPCVVSDGIEQKVEAECTVKLLSRLSNETLVTKYVKFFKPKMACVFKETISLAQLCNPKKQFLKDNKLSVEVHIACGQMENNSQSNRSIESKIEHDLKSNGLCSKYLPKRAKQFLDNCVGCDCELIIGSKKVRKWVSKAILALASEFFEQAFFGLMQEGDVIHIREEEYVFDIILLHIYGANWQFDSKSQAVEVYKAADFYILPKLQKTCVEYIWPTDVREIFVVLEFSLDRDMEGLKEQALTIIRANAHQVFEQEQFLYISIPSLKIVLQENNLKVRSELDVFEAVMRWGKFKCLEEGLDVCSENLRFVIGDCISDIRFLSMTVEEFSGGPYTSGLLTDEDRDAILSRLNSNDYEPMIGHLCCLTRKRTQY